MPKFWLITFNSCFDLLILKQSNVIIICSDIPSWHKQIAGDPPPHMRWSHGKCTSLLIERTVVRFHIRRFEVWAILFISFCLSFGRDSKSHWSLLSGVYTRGSKTSHARKWKKPVMDSLTLEKDALKLKILSAIS